MTKSLSNVALIPARSGSQRIANKNIFIVNKHPLLSYTIQSALNSEIFNRVVCITDSREYADIAIRYGAYVPKLRPKVTAKSTSPDIDWVNWILRLLSKKGMEFDTFSILRPTSPFRNESTIRRAFKQFKSHKKIDSLRAVELCKQHPGKMWKLESKGMQPLINKKINGIFWHSNQTKILPKFYIQNASLEISWVENVMQNNSISGKIIAPFITKDYEGFDINYPEDIEIMKYILRNNLASLPKITS